MFGVILVVLAVGTVCHGQIDSRFVNRNVVSSVDTRHSYNTGAYNTPGYRWQHAPRSSAYTDAKDNSKHSEPYNRLGEPYETANSINRNYERISTPVHNLPLSTLYSWKQVDFVFPSMNDREEMIRSQRFIPKNILVNDVEVYGEDPNSKIFVTLPRLLPGVPVTLATVSPHQSNGSYLLEPYPDWESQKVNQYGMSTIYRTHMDHCGRLWAMDSGSDGIDKSYIETASPPKILIYDVQNNKLIGRYPMPAAIAADVIMLVTIQVDARAPDCSDAHAYIADSLAFRMIVFNLQTGVFRSISNIQFFPYPDHSRHHIAGVTFSLGGGMYGIFGMAIGPLFEYGRHLYFHSFSSVKQSWVDTKDLWNDTLWQHSVTGKPTAFKLFGGSRPSQSIVSTMDQHGIMFFVLTATSELACWNSRDKFISSNIVILVKDEVALQANTGIKVYGNNLYLVTNRLQNFIKGRVNEDEVNYRVLIGDVRQLTAGTRCDVTNTPTTYRPDTENVL